MLYFSLHQKEDHFDNKHQLQVHTSTTTVVEVKDPPVTEKELKMHFNPPETTRQAEMLQHDLYTPPKNLEGL